MSEYLTFENVNSVDFAMSDKWHIYLPDAPAPFNDWVPAITCDIDDWNIQGYSFKIGHADFQVPISVSSKAMHFSVADSADLRFYKFIKDWINSIVIKSVGGYSGFNFFESSCKQLFVRELDSQLNKVTNTQYLICPYGQYSKSLTSNQEIRQMTYNFIIGGSREI
jgi:hypothetical protein